MPYRIVVEEIEEKDANLVGATGIKRYEQVVDQLDLKRVMEAVNYKPRGPRVKKGAQ